jgi:hypothetical protein
MGKIQLSETPGKLGKRMRNFIDEKSRGIRDCIQTIVFSLEVWEQKEQEVKKG